MLGGSYGVTLEDAELGQDHYIAQTYLKHFGDGSKGGMLNAYRKSDGAAFACWPKDVCREWDGDMNPLLSEPGLLGDFRGIFEPWWNLSVGAILGGDISPQEKFALSGYIANLMTCTPTWKRIGVRMNNDHMTGSLLFAKKMKERHGGQADLPVDAIESIEQGSIKLETDPNYIKAVYARLFIDCAMTTFGADWQIIENPTDELFVCSDNPVAYWERGPMVQPTVRYVPVTPRVCLEIVFDGRKIPRKSLTPDDVRAVLQHPPAATVKRVRYNKAGVRFINRVVVQCAEDLVFSPVASSRIEECVRKYDKWRIEVDYVELPGNKGEDAIYQGSILSVRETNRA